MNFFAQNRFDQPGTMPENKAIRDPYESLFYKGSPELPPPEIKVMDNNPFQGIGNPFGGMQGALGGIQSGTNNTLGGIQGAGQNALDRIQGAGQQVVGGAQVAGQNALDGIQGAGQQVVGGAQGAGQNALDGIQGAGQQVVDGIQSGKQRVVGGIKDANRVVDVASVSEFKTKIQEQAKVLSDKLNTVQDIVNASKDPVFEATSTQADIIASNIAKNARKAGEQIQADYAPLLENPADEVKKSTKDPNAYKDLNTLVNDSSNILKEYLQKELLNPPPVDSTADYTTSKCRYITSEQAKESFVQLYNEQVNGARLPNFSDALSITSLIKNSTNGVVGKVIVVMMLIIAVVLFVICVISFAGMTTEKKLATTACLSILLVVIFIFKLN